MSTASNHTNKPSLPKLYSPLADGDFPSVPHDIITLVENDSCLILSENLDDGRPVESRGVGRVAV